LINYNSANPHVDLLKLAAYKRVLQAMKRVLKAIPDTIKKFQKGFELEMPH
jgi:hypothetical protein